MARQWRVNHPYPVLRWRFVPSKDLDMDCELLPGIAQASGRRWSAMGGRRYTGRSRHTKYPWVDWNLGPMIERRSEGLGGNRGRGTGGIAGRIQLSRETIILSSIDVSGDVARHLPGEDLPRLGQVATKETQHRGERLSDRYS